MKKTGRVTIPTDSNFVEGTKIILKRWGADAVRDCDGTTLPENAKALADKVYNTYFVDRGDYEWATNNPDEWQHLFLMTAPKLASEKTLSVRLMDGYYDEQVKPDFNADSVKHLEVIDRTTGALHTDFSVDEKNGTVTVKNTIPFHQYTVSFLAISLWHPVHMYNYKTNNWDEPKHHMYDPYYPKTGKFIENKLQKWCEENPDTNVVRFTTFLYMFSLVFNEEGLERYVDWFGYTMAVSPKMLDGFEKEYGYRFRAEYMIDEGCYNSPHRVPKKEFLDYMDFVERFVCKTAKTLVDITHKNNKEAMMFLGDCWIGAEIYGKYFPDLNLDAVVGSVGGGVTVRMLSDIKGVKYTEGRFLPYFFPDTFFDGNEQAAVDELNRNWLTARRAMMRNPLDRIGFGGYLALAAKFPKFIDRAEALCDEFREIYANVKGKKPHNALTVGVLNAWGVKRSWMCYMTAHELWYQQAYSYQGILESLSGLPVDVKFINFDDVKNGCLKDIDVIINAGDAYTAWSGGEHWLDEQIVTAVRKFVHDGGGFVGIGEPTACQANGRYFQLSDVLGVDKEIGFSLNTDKYNIQKTDGHYIFADLNAMPDYGEDKKNIYAHTGTQILDIAFSDRFTRKVNVGEVKAAVNAYGKGRSFYMTGLPYSFENSRLLHRALLWAANKEAYQAYSTNINTECHYYKTENVYAVVNNSNEIQTTDFYDINGKKSSLKLQPMEIKWC